MHALNRLVTDRFGRDHQLGELAFGLVEAELSYRQQVLAAVDRVLDQGGASLDFSVLTPEQYHILREEGTERTYSSALNDEHRDGTFACAGCQLALFTSSRKFDSHTGWPSFWAPLPNAVATRQDRSLGVLREEVHCRRCGGHLGHVFDDGPPPTGLRYCMNGLAMTFAA